MAIGALKKYYLVFALLSGALAYSPFTTRTHPRSGGGSKVQMPRQTQPPGTLSTSQSTFSLMDSQLVASSLTSTANSIVTIPPACEIVNSLLSFCNSISTGFTTFAYEKQAQCLCYSNTTLWQPEIFDGAVATCAQDVSAIPSEYSQVASLEGFCLRSMTGCNASSTDSCRTTTPTPTPSGFSTTPSEIPMPTPTLPPTETPRPVGAIGIQITDADLTPGQKAGIGVGIFAAVSLAGYGIFAAVRIKKPAELNHGSEESGDIPSPQDDTTTTRAEKALTLIQSPEIHETKLAMPRAMTL